MVNIKGLILNAVKIIENIITNKLFVSYLKGNQEILTGTSMVITTSVFNKADSGPGLLPEEESSPRL